MLAGTLIGRMKTECHQDILASQRERTELGSTLIPTFFHQRDKEYLFILGGAAIISGHG